MSAMTENRANLVKRCRALERRLPPLAYKNSIEKIFGVVEAPTANVEWLENINFKALHEKWAAEEREEIQ